MKKLFLVFALCSFACSASAGIMIYPKFLFFDDKTKSAEVTLINSSPLESSNYRISISYKKQNPDGSYTEITSEDAPADSAEPILRYSPRSVMLNPNKSQTIRVLKRIPEGLEPGEYIAYITFTEVLLEKPATKPSKDNKTMTVRIIPIPSFSIPIFVRYKVKENAPVAISTSAKDWQETDTQTTLNVVLTRQEQQTPTSVRGDISVWNGSTMLGFIRGRYLLPGNTSVATKIPLKDKEDKPLKIKDLKGKKLTVLFTEPSEDKVDKSAVLAKTEVKL